VHTGSLSATLTLKGLVDRQTRELDFFSRRPEAADRIVESVDDALRAAGMSMRRLIEASGFVRNAVSHEARVGEASDDVGGRPHGTLRAAAHERPTVGMSGARGLPASSRRAQGRRSALRRRVDATGLR